MKFFKIQYIAIVSLLLLGGAGCSFSFNTKPEEKVAPTSVSLSGEALKAKIECENLKGTVETYITDINIPNEQRVLCKFQDGSECEQIDINDGFCKKQLELECEDLKGLASFKKNMERGEKEVFCSFADQGECTQNEMMTHTCFMQKQVNKNLFFTLPVGYNELSSNKLVVVLEKNTPRNYGRVEVFRMADFGNRPFGFSGDETEDDLVRYIPAEQKEIQIGEINYNIWMFYNKSDIKTKTELDSIVKSLKLK